LQLSPKAILEQRNKIQAALDAAIDAYREKKAPLADAQARLR